MKTHTLLRIRGAQALVGADLPSWADESLRRAPWVVIRRAPFRDGLIPVGVRGESRQQRFAAWICVDDVLEHVTPQALAGASALDPARRAAVPALAALCGVDKIMSEHGLERLWGPGGSVGFELASGVPTATSSSDLDVVVEVDRPFLDTACSLVAALATLPVRVDVLLETPRGAVALSEYALSRSESFVLRTTEGPRLTRTLGHTLGLQT